MANGRGEIIEEIRNLAGDEGVVIPQKVYNRLMLSALVELYDTVKPMSAWGTTIAAVRWVGGILGAAILLLVLSMVTHTFVWPF
jgi:hypothetical protein